MNYITKKHLPCRTFLRGMGAAVPLPLRLPGFFGRSKNAAAA